MKTLKERNSIDDNSDFLADVEAADNGSGETALGRSETDLLEKRAFGIDNSVEKRQDEGFNSLLTHP